MLRCSGRRPDRKPREVAADKVVETGALADLP